MMNFEDYAENLRKVNINIYVMLDLKRRIKEGTVFVRKAKTHLLNVLRKQTLPMFSIILNVKLN